MPLKNTVRQLKREVEFINIAKDRCFRKDKNPIEVIQNETTIVPLLVAWLVNRL